MKEFFKILKRFVPPYKKSLILSLIFTLFSAILNVFSFVIIIPILQILFKVNDASGVEFIDWSMMDSGNAKEVFFNNATWYMNSYAEEYGASFVMLLLGVFLIVMTLLKTGCYFGSSAAIIPMRTGIVRDMRTQLYDKIVSLPIGFFSKQRKGDIMARMIGDVGEVENSIATSLDMLIKKRGLTKSEFAEAIGKRPSEVTKWLSGQHNFTIRTLSMLSDFFDEALVVTA